MCIERITVKHRILKKDVIVYKLVAAVWKDQQISHYQPFYRDFSTETFVLQTRSTATSDFKVGTSTLRGFCCFKRLADVKKNFNWWDETTNIHILRCIIPKGTKVTCALETADLLIRQSPAIYVAEELIPIADITPKGK